MLQRTDFEIAPEKSERFATFIKNNAKTKEFWEQNKKDASKPINKKELDSLFAKEGR